MKTVINCLLTTKILCIKNFSTCTPEQSQDWNETIYHMDSLKQSTDEIPYCKSASLVSDIK